MNKTGKFFLYAGYTITAVIFFLYYLFPAEQVIHHLKNSLANTRPDLEVAIDMIKPVFPPGLKINRFNLAYKKKNIINLDQLKLQPKIFTLFGSEKQLVFKGKIGQGRLVGQTSLKPAVNSSEIELEVRLGAIEIKNLAALESLTDYQLAGILDGEIFYKNKGPFGNGTAVLEISKGSIKFKPPFFTITKIDITKIETDLILRNKNLDIKNCTLKGPQLNGKVAGIILLRQPLENSILKLSGLLKPTPELIASLKKKLPSGLFSVGLIKKKGLSFKIHGTIAKPGFSLK